jgi:tetratricopeptide (TPR) repeat protein
MRPFPAEDAIAEAERLAIEATCQQEEATQSRLLAEARSVLDRALSTEPNNPRLHHMLGLCWYQDLARDAAICQAIESHFKAALQLAPAYAFPSLYLGHFYFDEGRYTEALPLFQKVNEDYFEQIGQKWRILKNRELVLCCRLYLHPREVDISELEAVCQAYLDADQEDAPVPTEIVTCIANLTEVPLEMSSAMARRVKELLRKLGYENAFWVRDDYQRLQQFAS